MRKARKAGLLLLALLLVGCARDGANPGAKRIYSREEFKREFLGATLTEVREKLGAPDEVESGLNGVYWGYKKRTKNSKTGAVDERVVLAHENDRVTVIAPGPD